MRGVSTRGEERGGPSGALPGDKGRFLLGDRFGDLRLVRGLLGRRLRCVGDRDRVLDRLLRSDGLESRLESEDRPQPRSCSGDLDLRPRGDVLRAGDVLAGDRFRPAA